MQIRKRRNPVCEFAQVSPLWPPWCAPPVSESEQLQPLARRLIAPPPPDFTCPDQTVCVFDESGYVGNHDPLATPSHHSVWIQLPFLAESINDNSNSAVQLYSDLSGKYQCVTGKENLPSSSELDWIFISYNEPNCDEVRPFP